MRRFWVAMVSAAIVGLGATASAIAEPAPAGLSGGCLGITHAGIAQDARITGDVNEPLGFGPVVRYFGFTPTSANAEIAAECASQ